MKGPIETVLQSCNTYVSEDARIIEPSNLTTMVKSIILNSKKELAVKGQ